MKRGISAAGGRVLAAALGAAAFAACGPDDPPQGSELVFPEDLAASDFVQVRPCRAPGEHSALGGFTVWVDPASEQAFAELWADPPLRDEMPAGAVIVKEMYNGSDCVSTDVTGWVAMKKEPGFNPESGDWYWQELTADGDLTTDGRDAGCTGCHRGSANTSCTGYGAENGRDYVCTEP